MADVGAAIYAVEGSIKQLARRYANTRVPREDLEQAARCELVRRYRDFDLDKGSWHTFAYSVARGAMQHYIRDLGWMVRIPAWRTEAGEANPECRSLDFIIADGAESLDMLVAPAEPDIELRLDVQRALSGLKPRDRIALHLHYWQGLSFAEMAPDFGIGVSAMQALVRRAELKLRRTMALWRIEGN